MNNVSDNTVSPITFHVFRSDGSRNPDIRHSFIKKQSLTAHDVMEGFITLDDKTVWRLLLESKVSEAIRNTNEVSCIVSYQVRSSGNYAVARLFSESYKSKGRHS